MSQKFYDFDSSLLAASVEYNLHLSIPDKSSDTPEVPVP